MLHLRSDYDAIQPWPLKRPHLMKINGKVLPPHPETGHHEYADGDVVEPIIPDDEPVFLLRASDPVASETVRAWADFASRAGAESLLVLAVLDWADRMDDYHAQKAARSGFISKAAPDVPADRLRYQVTVPTVAEQAWSEAVETVGDTAQEDQNNGDGLQ